MTSRLPQEVDPRTLTRFREGDPSAQGAIFQAYGQRVYRLARRLMGNQADAEDATQEIFVRAFEQAHRFDGRSALFTWLYRLTVWHCFNKLKQRKRRQHHEGEASVPAHSPAGTDGASVVERLSAAERGRLAAQLLASLPPPYRACIVLREVEGLPDTRIAELLDVPLGTVMSRLSRARRKLQAEVAALEGREGGNSVGNRVVQSSEEQGRDAV